MNWRRFPRRTPVDIPLAELALETVVHADAATAAALRRLADA